MAGDARERSSAVAYSGCDDRVSRPPEKVATVWISAGSGPTTSMPGTIISSLICWMARSASPVIRRSAVNPDGTIRLLTAAGDAQAVEQAGEEDAAGADLRIGDRAGRQQRGLEVLRPC